MTVVTEPAPPLNHGEDAFSRPDFFHLRYQNAYEHPAAASTLRYVHAALSAYFESNQPPFGSYWLSDTTEGVDFATAGGEFLRVANSLHEEDRDEIALAWLSSDGVWTTLVQKADDSDERLVRTLYKDGVPQIRDRLSRTQLNELYSAGILADTDPGLALAKVVEVVRMPGTIPIIEKAGKTALTGANAHDEKKN